MAYVPGLLSMEQLDFRTRTAMSDGLYAISPIKLLAATNYEFIAVLVLASPVALGRNSPRRTWMPATRTPAFSTTHRVIDRVHGNAAHVGAFSHPPFATGLTQ
jgi:hypothetical protein